MPGPGGPRRLGKSRLPRPARQEAAAIGYHPDLTNRSHLWSSAYGMDHQALGNDDG